MTCWKKSKGGPPSCSEGWSTSPLRKGSGNLVCFWKRNWKRFWVDLITAFQYLKGTYRKDEERLLARVHSDRTRGNSIKLKESRCGLDIRMKCFTVGVATHWNKLPREVVEVPSQKVFKTRLNGALSNLVWLKLSLTCSRGITRRSLRSLPKQAILGFHDY